MMSSKLWRGTVEKVGKHCDMSDRELYLRRRDIRKAVYVGVATIGISIPVVIVNYLPLINNFIKNRDIDARTIGTIGLTVGINLIATAALRGYEYFKSMQDMNERLEEIKNLKRITEINEPSEPPHANINTKKYRTKKSRKTGIRWKGDINSNENDDEGYNQIR